MTSRLAPASDNGFGLTGRCSIAMIRTEEAHPRRSGKQVANVCLIIYTRLSCYYERIEMIHPSRRICCRIPADANHGDAAEIRFSGKKSRALYPHFIAAKGWRCGDELEEWQTAEGFRRLRDRVSRSPNGDRFFALNNRLLSRGRRRGQSRRLSTLALADPEFRWVHFRATPTSTATSLSRRARCS